MSHARRRIPACILGLLALALGAAHAAAPGDTGANATGKPHAKPSSYAPHPPPADHAYGTPIEPPILKSRTHRKAHKPATPAPQAPVKSPATPPR